MTASPDDLDALVDSICDDPADTWPVILFEIRLGSRDPYNTRWAKTLWWRLPDDVRASFLESVVRFGYSGPPRLRRVSHILGELVDAGIEDMPAFAAFLREWMETACADEVAELHDRYPEAVERALAEPYAEGRPWAERIRRALPPDIEHLRWTDAVRAGQMSLFDTPDGNA